MTTEVLMVATALQLLGVIVVLTAAWFITPALTVLVAGALVVAAGLVLEVRGD